jgi:hypothetical protein
MQQTIMLFAQKQGVYNERRFLNTLAGPNGESISYNRIGSVRGQSGLLDWYSITYAGLDKPISLYIDMYNAELLKIPVGFM